MHTMHTDVILVNLTRFGDLLQTQPLINDLHLAGKSVGLVCLENFVHASRLLKNAQQVWPLPGAALLRDLDHSWPGASALLLKWTRDIACEADPEYVVNLTPSTPARLLGHMLCGPKTRLLGFGVDNFGFGYNDGVWGSFFSVAARQRINAPFNVADMLRNLALPITNGLRGDFRLASPPADKLEWAGQFLEPIRREHQPAGLVAIQLGASNDKRRWAIDHFAQLGDLLWREARLLPILTGSEQEKALADKYASHASHPFVNACGQTDHLQLGALLRQTKLLVTNDTGTMHLAAGLDIPVIAIFLATAQPWDTGPLLPGCACLEPDLPCHPCAFNHECHDPVCRTAIKAEDVARLALRMLQNPKRDTLKKETVAGARLWLTGKDAIGNNMVELCGATHNSPRNTWLSLLRDFWSQLLDACVANNMAKPGKSGIADTLPDLPANTAQTLIQAAGILESLHEMGQLAKINPQAGQLFLKNCERLQAMLESCGPLTTLAAFWREARQNQGGDLDKFLPIIQIMALHLRRFGETLDSA